MNLSEEQKIQVADWVREGASVSEVQKRLEENFSVRPTYMDVRFLIDDLDLTLADKPAAKAKKAPEPADADGNAGGDAGEAVDAELMDDGPAGTGTSKVSVTIDKITKPGSLVSGTVSFSDGNKAQWFLDQMGRLALNPGTPGYKPSQADIAAFQRELQDAVERQGGMF